MNCVTSKSGWFSKSSAFVCVKRLVWVAGLPQNRIREELPLLGAGTKQQAAKFGEGRGWGHSGQTGLRAGASGEGLCVFC